MATGARVVDEEVRAAFLMAELIGLQAITARRRAEGAPEIVLAHLERLCDLCGDAWHDWREGVQEEAGQDPAVWGPVFDRVAAMSRELRGCAPRAPGLDSKPHGETAH